MDGMGIGPYPTTPGLKPLAVGKPLLLAETSCVQVGGLLLHGQSAEGLCYPRRNDSPLGKQHDYRHIR